MPKKALGKGLDALLPKLDRDVSQRIFEISLDKIDSNPKQPRKHFDANQLQELAESIQTTGVLQPIIVQPHQDRYLIIFGERRVRASRLAGLKTIPALIKHYSEKKFLQLALIENLQREDLNPIEQALAFDEIIVQFQLTQEDMATQLGKDRSFIANTIRLLKLPDQIQEFIKEGTLSAGNARALLALRNEREQILLAQKIIQEQWSVRQTEQFFKRKKRKHQKADLSSLSPAAKDPNLFAAREKMIHYLGTKVSIVSNSKGGQIVINYFGEDDLNRILNLILK